MKIQSRPFTVTVKRPRRSKDKSIWSDTPNLTAMLAEAAEPPAGDSATPSPPLAPRPQPKGRSAGSTPSKGPLPRILADLTPVEMPPVVEEPPVRRRGRPRKVLNVETTAGEARTARVASDTTAAEHAPADKAPGNALIGEPAIGRPSRSEAQNAGEPVARASTARAAVLSAGRKDGPAASPFRSVSKTVAAWLAEPDEPETVVADAPKAQDRVALPLGGGEVAGDAASDEQLAVRRRRITAKAVPGQRWKRHLPRWKR